MALVLTLGLVVGAGTSQATDLTWTNGSDYWQSTTAWSPAGSYPGPGDNVFFSEASMYTVTLTNDVTDIASNFFQNPVHTTAIVTLDLGTNSLSVISDSTSPGAFNVGENGTEAEVYLYLVSSTNVGKGLFVTNSADSARLVIGGNGFGAMFVPNGNVTANSLIFANDSGGRGVLALSGADTYWTNSGIVSIGNAQTITASGNLVISNSASMIALGAFKVGAVSGSCFNSVLLDTGGRLFTKAEGTVIGGDVPSSNNTVAVQGGAIWDNGNQSLTIGVGAGAVTNSLAIGTGSAVTSVSMVMISATNTLNLQGGLLQVSDVVSNFGTINGFGTIAGDVVQASGGLLTPGSGSSLGTMALSNSLTLASGSVTTLKLDKSQLSSNDLLNVTGALSYGGTLTITNVGQALGDGDTFQVLAFGSRSGDFAVTNLPPLGSGLIWDTSQLAAQGILTVSAPLSASFTGSPTNGAAPLAVTFTDSSGGTITNRYWDFGDGNTTNTTTTGLSHTYGAAGTRTVSLTVSGPVGDSTLIRTNYIVALNPAQLVVNPGSLNYGAVTVGLTNSLSFSVINTGDLPLSGTATSAPPFVITSGGAYNDLAGGQTQMVTVAFAPSSASTFNGWVLFTSTGGDSINAVSGSGLTPCSYMLSTTNAIFGVTGGSNTVIVVASTNLCLWTASSNNGWIQIAGGGVSATGSAVVAYTVLSNTSSSNARTGTMTIAGQTFTVTQAGDTTAPTVALTAPTSGIVSNTITVGATATDDVAVVKVEFYRDNSVLLGTVTTSPYNVNFDTTSLGDGSHCFYAKAYDAANNVSGSSTNCVTVDNNAPTVPTGLTATVVSSLQVNLSWNASSDGGGSGVAGYLVFRDGTQIVTAAGTSLIDFGLASGTEYCYTVAAFDQVGHTSAQSANACVRTFDTFASLQGTYNGLVVQTNAPSHASSGSLKLVISQTGSFAANLTMGGVKSVFKGQFDDSGNATIMVTRKGLSSLQVTLHLDAIAGTEQITGTVSNGVFTSELLADRAVYSRTNPSPWAGRYTIVLEPPEGSDPDIPQGYGYGTLIAVTSGGGKLSGVLGDGTKITGNAPVSKHGTWPLYNALYKKQGACIGWVTFATNDTLAATVDWFRPSLPTSAYYPAGFATNVALIGEIYVAPSAGGPSPAGDREITLGGGNLVSSIVETVSVNAVGKVIVLTPNSVNLKLKLQPATGQVSGSFRHPVLNKTVSFKGLVLQIENTGAGCFLGTNESGYVILEPVP